LCAAFIVAVQLGFGPRYPVFRDELYYLQCADHLAWGFVDHPPLSIFTLWLWRGLFGNSLLSLRVLASIAAECISLLVSHLAGRLGGSSFARLLAALTVIAAPTFWGITGFYSMNAFDLLFWVAAADVVAGLCVAGTPRLWVTLGVVLGLGLLNKIGLLVFGAGLAAAMVLTPTLRAQLKTRWPYLAAGLAVVIAAPTVAWQLANGWPTLEFIDNAAKLKNVSLGPVGFFTAQILDVGPLNAVIWLSGLGWLLVARRAQPFRGLAIIFIVSFISFMGGKAYYLVGALLILLGAGAVALEQWVGARPGLQRGIIATIAVLALVPLPIVVPVLSPEQVEGYMQALHIAPERAERSELGTLPQHFADRFGWDELTELTSRAFHSLTPQEQQRAEILGSNYGEAGAINYYGARYGLPKASSQHNSFYFWGLVNPTADIVIVIGESADDLKGVCGEVQTFERAQNRLSMPYERENPIAICRKPKRPLPELFARGKMFI
jgi:hypothetical protein